MTVPITSTTAGGTEIIGVRLQPGVGSTLLGVGARALLNLHVPLRDIWPPTLSLPWEEVASASDLPATLAAIASAIDTRLTHSPEPDTFVRDATRWIAAHPSGNLAELTRLSGMSERQIRRRFDDAIGYGPKMVQRILRLQRLLWLASQEPGFRGALGRLAFAVGYTDQPHMTREIVALAGRTPGQLLASSASSAVSDLFKTSPR
jgi:AraC-like DNA-binding protein